MIGTAVFTAGLFLVVIAFAIRAQLRPHAVGTEALIGRIGKVRDPLRPTGSVLVGGEIWSAEAEEFEGELDEGARVEVTGVEGLRLNVRPVLKKPD